MGIKSIITTALALATTLVVGAVERPHSELFNDNWRFNRDVINVAEGYDRAQYDTSGKPIPEKYSSVTLPHTAFVESFRVHNQWQGLCTYTKRFDVEGYASDRNYFMEFEGAMGIADVYVNGEHVKHNESSYLPFVIDLSGKLKAKGNTIKVTLDNRDNPTTGPKPVAILDFCNYSGIYRNVWFYSEGSTFITNPTLVDRVAGGGIFITTPVVSEKQSIVNVKTNVENSDKEAKSLTIVQSIYHGDQVVAKSISKGVKVAANGNVDHTCEIKLKGAALWSPDAPNLYTLKSEIFDGKESLDIESTRFGVREFKFVDNKLYINGKQTFLRGANRHQEYPYIGNALSDNAQYRDAYKMKAAGYDYVRLSHYPNSTAFMSACDEVGIVVLDAILGWQYYNDIDPFRESCYDSARRLIRRDRNHASVLAWEVSLNETQMPKFFMEKLHKIVHTEYPHPNTYSAGWMHGVYDIYLQARQHRIGHPDEVMDDRPYMVSEYGDWEYYSTNAGLNQDNMPADERRANSSRHFRDAGEAKLLIQVKNLQESHNDNLSIHAYSDAFWLCFDHNRGYHNEISAPGVMDINRLPKFAYYLYASQRDIEEVDDYVLFIASYWDVFSDPHNIKVMSNAEEVGLYCNGKLIARQRPDNNKISTNLPHAPFTFDVGSYERGELRAVAYKGGEKIGETTVKTPQHPTKLRVWIDESGRPAEAGVNDVVFIYIAAEDENGTINPYYKGDVELKLPKSVSLINVNGNVECEAGIAAALVQLTPSAKSGEQITIEAQSIDGMNGAVLKGSTTTIYK
ncbi:MAG: glycoside hydrolase family 2 TIM barrel-domain containing protein [Rikenellaceae bacterium]